MSNERQSPGWLQRANAWLWREAIWKDVFTRTVSTVLSLSIVALFGAAVGVIRVDMVGWLRVLTAVGLILFWPLDRYVLRPIIKDEGIRTVVVALLAAIYVVGMGFIIYSATGPHPPSTACIQLDGCL